MKTPFRWLLFMWGLSVLTPLHADDLRSLDSAAFQKSVFDYENESEWKFLGAKPAVVVFVASWCQPCRMETSILAGLAGEYGSQVDFFRVDTDEESGLAAAFGIQSIPAVLFIPLGQTPQMNQGAMPRPQVVKALQNLKMLPGQ